MASKTLFLKLFQPYAQYRNPFTFYYAQTYPLPPKSTIVGMLQNAMDDWYGTQYGYSWDELDVSIHGVFESVFWNYQNLIKGYPTLEDGRLVLETQGQGEKSAKQLPLYGQGKTAQRSPVYQQELFNGRLYVFLKMRDGGDGLLEELYLRLDKPKKVLSLGRSEDVIFIKNVVLLNNNDIEKANVEGDIKITCPTYILLEKEMGDHRVRFPISNQKYPVFYLPRKSRFYNGDKPVKYKSEIKLKNTRREAEFTPVIYTATDYSIILSSDASIEVEFYKVESESNCSEFRIISGWGWL
ncbi:MAG: CRISPR-associated protein Cas5 [Nitrososphaeria archaeon]